MNRVKKFLIKESLDKESWRLIVTVNTNAIDKLREILSKEQRIGSRFENISKLYVFFFWMTQNRIKHVSRGDLAKMIYANHEDRVTKGIKTLEEHGLVEVNYQPNKQASRCYYTYQVKTFDFEISQKTIPTTDFVFEIPMVLAFSLTGNNNKTKNPIDRVGAANGNIGSPICPSPIIRPYTSEKDTFQKRFRSIFIEWYNDLIFDGMVVPSGYFSPKDGRFYHHFHRLSKEERERVVTWDGEHVEEVWDAHSSFFIVLGYYLKKVKMYDSEDDKRKFTKEANSLLIMAMNDTLYSNIQKYHNSNSDFKVGDRGVIKKWVQAYKNQPYKNLYKKDGSRTNYKWAKKFQYIDEFFEKYFPNIRLLLLNYPRRRELVEYEKHDANGNVIGTGKSIKSVSNLQRDMMPYEFQLISMGICGDLYRYEGIKAITVHDAIYVKKSDAEKQLDIDDYLSLCLGLECKHDSIALF